MAIQIRYSSSQFPPATGIATGDDDLNTTWDELLWSAITFGREVKTSPLLSTGASLYEAIFRLSAIRMTLQETVGSPTRLERTSTFRNLDPSEKGMLSYFVSMTLCKLFAFRRLRAPWVLHLDVFRHSLNVQLLPNSQRRPDLIAKTNTSEWITMEAKGRVRPPGATAIAEAKDQATRCVSVDGHNVKIHAACFAYYQTGTLQFMWEDPPARPKSVVNTSSLNSENGPRGNNRFGGKDSPPPDGQFGIAEFNEDDVWQAYYRHALSLSLSEAAQQEVDCVVSIHPEVQSRLLRGAWEDAHVWAIENPQQLAQSFNPDGVRLKAGPSWGNRSAQE